MRRESTQGKEDLTQDTALYLSQSQLVKRWNCSHTSVQRIAEREGFRRYLIGEGRNGMVRYRLDEIVAYENARCAGAVHR